MPLDFGEICAEPLAFQCKGRRMVPSKHLLFQVKNSVGRLRKVLFRIACDGPLFEDMVSVLQLGDTPLLFEQFSGSPTSESLLGAGYGIPASDPALEEAAARMNACEAVWKTGRKAEDQLEEALDRLKPVLGLLNPGLYVLSYSEYCPTDGEGRFFWDMSNQYRYYQATAQIYDSDNYRVLPDFPCFLCPTQPPEKLDEARMEYYRGRLGQGEALAPALAYYIDGSVSALLDGHHRAAACALEGKYLPCLTISEAVCCMRRDPAVKEGKEAQYRAFIQWPDASETEAASVLTPEQVEMLRTNTFGEWKEARVLPPAGNLFQRQWPPEFVTAAEVFPTCKEAAAMALYPYEELTAEGIVAFSLKEDRDETQTAADLLHFMCRQAGADKKALAMAVLQKNAPLSLRIAAYEILSKIKNDEEIEDLFVEILVECEDKGDPIRRLASAYWD